MAPKNLAPLLVDENLLGLTRWLRFLGFDARMAKGWKDPEVAAFARARGRTLITRDAELASAMGPHPVVRVRADDPRAQLVAVLRHLQVADSSRWFSRCVRCNQPLARCSPDEAARDERVPCFWREQPAAELWRCEKCAKTYWRGSHFTRTREFLKGVREEVAAGAGHAPG